MPKVVGMYAKKTAPHLVARAVELLGGRTAAAKRLGVAVPTVSEWATGAAELPILRAIQLEQLTSKAVLAEQMRPDAADALRYLRGQTCTRHNPPQAL